MFRKIRKKKNELSLDEAKNLLTISKRGVLCLNGDDGYPYGLPINYFYDKENDKIYFHSSKIGYKIDCLKRDDKISFTIIGKEEIRQEKWAPFVKSVIVFGRCKVIDDKEKSLECLRKFAMKYYPSKKAVDDEISLGIKGMDMFEISILHMSIKEVCEK